MALGDFDLSNPGDDDEDSRPDVPSDGDHGPDVPSDGDHGPDVPSDGDHGPDAPPENDLGFAALPEEDALEFHTEDDGLTIQVPGGVTLPIPPELHSVYEEGPFTKCTACQKPLDGLGLYEIQKVYRGSEVIFETALCHLCGEELVRELSEESLSAMKGFLLGHFKPTSELDHCHFCGFPRGLFANFTVVGACRDSSLLVPQILMCEKCSESLNERLSQKTRDIQGDFVQDHFPGVPADLDLSPSLGGLF